MTSRITVVLLTHERPVFLRRALAYYASLDADVLVLDSSADGADELRAPYPDLAYIHSPGLSFLEKIRAGIAAVTTPYLAFCGDDDFLFPDGVAESVAFLDAHTDYGMCRGYELMYVPEAAGVHYILRDKKVVEDFSADAAGPRILDFMGNFLPPYYAVTRTDLLRDWFAIVPAGTGYEFQELGHAYYLLARAKARVLPRPYALREANVDRTEHGTDLFTSLAWDTGHGDDKRDQKRRFVEFLVDTTVDLGYSRAMAGDIVLAAIDELAECLGSLRSLHVREIFYSEWPAGAEQPNWRFLPTQYLEMPFYEVAFFEQLAAIDLTIRVAPASRLQLAQLADALAMQDTVVAEVRRHLRSLATFRPVLEEAFQANPFHVELAGLLAQASHDRALAAWHTRLVAATTPRASRQLVAVT